MSKNYSHLSIEQRYQIEALLESGTSQKEIARIVGKHPSTITREIKRNTGSRGYGALLYRAKNAQRRTTLRHKEKPKKEYFTSEMKSKCRSWLMNERLSPEFIHAQGQKQIPDFVSHETIYKWIWDCKHTHRKENKGDEKLYKYLAHGRRRRKRGRRRECRGIIPFRVSIEQRPKIVAKRKRFGDFEVDLMMGKNYKGALLVMTDRCTLKTELQLLKTKDSHVVKKAIIGKLKKWKGMIKTLTFDNDSAFTLHQVIAKQLNAQSYFTRPYTSQDKGTVENRIGVIRRFFPKGTDLLLTTNQEVKQVQYLINNRPIRKYNYKSANKVFSEKIALMT